jgi:hypothetical protein
MDEIEFSEGERAADYLTAAVAGRKMIPSSYHWCDWCEGMRWHGSNECPNKRTGEPTRGGKRPNAGRKPPEVQKVRLSTWVLPSTKAALGLKPGQRLDDLFKT